MHQPASTIGRAAARLLAWVGIALTAGCLNRAALPPAPPPIAPAVASAEAAPPRLAVPRPARKPTPPKLAALPPPVELAPEIAGEGFERLQGLDEAATLAMLGEPKERGEAPPAVVWRYAAQNCALEVFFYLDLQSQSMRVLHYEVRDQDDGAERSHQKCYRELVTDRGAEQAGGTDRPR